VFVKEGVVEEPASARGVQAIVRALSVLRAFSPERSTLSVSEIAPIVGVSVPTAHRIATTLHNQGYLSRDPATKAFSLGPELLRLATLISETRPQTVDLRVLTAIRAATGETVSLHIRVGDRRVCFAEEVSRHPHRITSGVGQSYSLLAGAASKVMLSLLDDDEVERLMTLEADSDARPLPREKLLAAVREARASGFAISEGETVLGAVAVAVPVPSTGLGPPTVLNLVGPRDRMTPEAIDSGLAAIRSALQPLAHHPSG
jgi:DNA-binding IclR family transcriptional regulator